MLKREVFSYYKDYCKDLEKAYEIIKSHYSDTYVDELCQLRGYVGEEQRALISELQIGCCELPVLELGERRKELGLVTDTDDFLLSGRYIVPIRDIEKNLVALVGYYPDYKKYITTPSMFFSKETLFFNIDHAFELSHKEFNGLIIVVEGIFDCLSLRAIGLPCIATMGSTVTDCKEEQLKLFKKVLYFPDNDKIGRKALNRYDSTGGWKVPHNATGVKLEGKIEIGEKLMKIKDVDNLVSWFDAETVRNCILQFADSKEDIETLSV